MDKLATWSILTAAALAASPARAATDGNEEIKAKEVSEAPVGEAPAAAPATEEAKPAVDATDLSPIDGVVGHVGLGYFTNSAPIGARYWLTRTSAVDLGIDFALSSGGIHAHRYGLDLGYVMALAHYHYAVVFARAGLAYRFLDTFGKDALPARHDIGLSAFVGAELFLGVFGFPNISLMGGYGLSASYTYNAGSAFIVGTSTPGLSVTGTGTLGFHIYL